MSCPRCGGWTARDVYRDLTCINCGWVEPPADPISRKVDAPADAPAGDWEFYTYTRTRNGKVQIIHGRSPRHRGSRI